MLLILLSWWPINSFRFLLSIFVTFSLDQQGFMCVCVKLSHQLIIYIAREFFGPHACIGMDTMVCRLRVLSASHLPGNGAYQFHSQCKIILISHYNEKIFIFIFKKNLIFHTIYITFHILLGKAKIHVNS